MISLREVYRLMEREDSGRPVLSLYLDTSVGPDHRRTAELFLAQQRHGADALAAAAGARRDAVEDALDRAAEWLAAHFEPENRGVAVFVEIGGPWLLGVQLPIPLPASASVERRPTVAPLLRALQGRRRHALVLVDRSHLRMLDVWLGRVLEEEVMTRDPYPVAHDVRGGGHAEQRYQRRKLEEEKHFFTEFSDAVTAFVARTGADDVVLMGTDRNVAQFIRFLPESVASGAARTRVVRMDGPTAEVVERVGAMLDAGDPEGAGLLADLRERMGAGHLAAVSVQPTLDALQTGKVEALLLADDPAPRGWRCTHCGFLFAEERTACPFDGGEIVNGVPVVEEAIRLAAAQGARSRLFDPEEAEDFQGAGVLLRF